MSETEPYMEDVETFCSKKRRQVLILLRTSQEQAPRGNTITGVPVSCNFEGVCSKGELCLLKANQITTRRKP